MKKYLLLLIFYISLISLSAQERGNPKYDLDIRLGYTIPSESSLNPGFTFGLEPRYWVGSKFSLGLKADIHKFGSELADASPNDSQSFVLMGDFYSSEEKDDRLFTGIGVGLFRDGRFSGVFGSGGSRTNEGITGRVGYLRDQVRLGFEFNVILGDDAFDYYGFYFSWSPF